MAFPGYGFWLIDGCICAHDKSVISALHRLCEEQNNEPLGHVQAVPEPDLYERKSDARLSIETATSQNRLVPTFLM